MIATERKGWHSQTEAIPIFKIFSTKHLVTRFIIYIFTYKFFGKLFLFLAKASFLPTAYLSR